LTYVIPFTIAIGTGLGDQQAHGISIGPNPTRDEIIIRSEKVLIGTELQLRDASGKLLRAEKFNGTLRIEMNAHAPGTYFLFLIDAEGSRTAFPIVKQSRLFGRIPVRSCLRLQVRTREASPARVPAAALTRLRGGSRMVPVLIGELPIPRPLLNPTASAVRQRVGDMSGKPGGRAFGGRGLATLARPLARLPSRGKGH